MIPETFLVVGASRGIGQEFVAQLSTREHTVVYAAVRNHTAQARSTVNGPNVNAFKFSPSAATAVEGAPTDSLPIKKPSANDKGISTKFEGTSITKGTATANDPAPLENDDILHMKLDVTSDASVAAAAATIEDFSIDVIIINAGICHLGALKDQGPESMREIMETNICGPMRIIDAFKGKMRGAKKIVVLSSLVGSIGMCWGQPCGTYNISKAGVNMLVKQYSIEYKEEGLVFLAIHPGWVDTSMGNLFGLPPPQTVQESVKGMLQVIEDLTPEESGCFKSWEGKIIPY